MTYTATNALNDTVLVTDSMADALAHVGRHVHVTRDDGFTAGPMDLQNGRCDRVTMWAALTGRTVRHDVVNGTPNGIIGGWIEVSR